jgi:hypothetical protein
LLLAPDDRECEVVARRARRDEHAGRAVEPREDAAQQRLVGLDVLGLRMCKKQQQQQQQQQKKTYQ